MVKRFAERAIKHYLHSRPTAKRREKPRPVRKKRARQKSSK